jgi:hypothetical protein
MRSLVKFPLEDGTFVVAEVDDADQLGIRDVKRDRILNSPITLEAALDKVRPGITVVLDKVRSMAASVTADEIELEFGIKLSTEVGAIFATAGLEANYKVTLHWCPDRNEKHDT